jgi:hypothetical protein
MYQKVQLLQPLNKRELYFLVDLAETFCQELATLAENLSQLAKQF